MVVNLKIAKFGVFYFDSLIENIKFSEKPTLFMKEKKNVQFDVQG
jgi:hypothetical protein